MIKPFESIVFQLFLDMLRASGMALNAQQIDMLRSASQNFAHSFKAEAQLSCLQFLKEFQDNVKETIEPLEAKVKQLESSLSNSSQGNNVDLFGSPAKIVIVPPREQIVEHLSKELDKPKNNPDN